MEGLGSGRLRHRLAVGSQECLGGLGLASAPSASATAASAFRKTPIGLPDLPSRGARACENIADIVVGKLWTYREHQRDHTRHLGGSAGSTTEIVAVGVIGRLPASQIVTEVSRRGDDHAASVVAEPGSLVQLSS